jgi:Mg/Co/Ni transporter MgtE
MIRHPSGSQRNRGNVTGQQLNVLLVEMALSDVRVESPRELIRNESGTSSARGIFCACNCPPKQLLLSNGTQLKVMKND